MLRKAGADSWDLIDGSATVGRFFQRALAERITANLNQQWTAHIFDKAVGFALRSTKLQLFAKSRTSGGFSGSGGVDPSRVAIYIRWSTDDQSEGTTLDTQRDACLDYARSQGFGTVPVDRIFIDDGHSGATLERPAMKNLRAKVSTGEITCVVVYTIDRLSRNIVDAVNLVLDEWNDVCHLKCVRQPIDTTTDLGRMIFGILAMFADFERSQIRVRTFSGRLKRASQGRNPGGRPVLGYKIGDSQGDIVIDEERALLVRRIFTMYASGLGDRSIATALNHEAIPAPRGTYWGRGTVRKILSNERYIGKWPWGETKRNPSKTDGPKRIRTEEPLAFAMRTDLAVISDELFAACQSIRERTAILVGAGKTSGKSISSDHLLSGLVKCRCGSQMRIDIDKRNRRGGSHLVYFRCAGRQDKGSSFCDAGRVSEGELEALVVSRIKRLSDGETRSTVLAQLRETHARRLRQAEMAQVAATARLNQLEGELAHINQDYRRQKLDVDDFNRMRNEIQAERETLKKSLSSSQSDAAFHAQQLSGQARAIDLFNQIDDWETLGLPGKKSLLLYLVEFVTVYRRKGTTAPVEVQIQLHAVPGSIFDEPNITNPSSL